MIESKPRRSPNAFGGIRKTPLGHYQARYTHDKKVFSKTFPKRKEASDWLSAQQTAVRSQTWVDPNSMAFKDWFESWLLRSDRRPTTIQKYRSQARSHFGPIWERSLTQIRPIDISDLVVGWRKLDRKGQPTNSPLAPVTTSTLYALLAAVFSSAADLDLINKSPCRGVTLPPRETREVPELTTENLAALARAMPEPWAPMVWLAGILGLRIGEIAALRVSDIDFLPRRLYVRRSLARVTGQGTVIHEPKTKAGKRDMGVPEALIKILAAHIQRYGLSGDDELFRAARGGRFEPRRWEYTVWDRVRTSCGFPGLHFHDLRGVATTLMVDNGVKIKTIQSRLGHASAQTSLDIYAKRTTRADVESTEILDRLMNEALGKASESILNPSCVRNLRSS